MTSSYNLKSKFLTQLYFDTLKVDQNKFVSEDPSFAVFSHRTNQPLSSNESATRLYDNNMIQCGFILRRCGVLIRPRNG